MQCTSLISLLESNTSEEFRSFDEVLKYPDPVHCKTSAHGREMPSHLTGDQVIQFLTEKKRKKKKKQKQLKGRQSESKKIEREQKKAERELWKRSTAEALI